MSTVAEATVYSVLCGLLAVSLLCAAGAVWLWQRALNTQQRVSTERYVDSRLAMSPGGPGTPVHASAASAGTVQWNRGAPGDTHAQASAAPAGSRVQGLLDAQRARSGAPSNVQAAAADRAAGGSRAPSWLGRRLVPVQEAAQRVLRRAGIRDIRRFYILTGLALVALTLYVVINVGWIAAAISLVFELVVLRLWLWRRSTRQQLRIVAQLPQFLDGVVRMITIGNSVPAAFQAAVPAADEPLLECLERASRMMRAGQEIDKALNNIAEFYKVEEFMLIASVVRLSVKYGGRADVVLERMAAFMRDREMAQRELRALSAETRMSAWILGTLPVGLAIFIIFNNPTYFSHIWFDTTGRQLFFGAIGLQLFGGFLLYRLAKL